MWKRLHTCSVQRDPTVLMDGNVESWAGQWKPCGRRLGHFGRGEKPIDETATSVSLTFSCYRNRCQRIVDCSPPKTVGISQGKAWHGPPNLGILEEHLFFSIPTTINYCRRGDCRKIWEIHFFFFIPITINYCPLAGNEKMWQKTDFCFQSN